MTLANSRPYWQAQADDISGVGAWREQVVVVRCDSRRPFSDTLQQRHP